MSDDILSVATPFPDVASLAQGYINRVDGERLLVPLEVPCEEGAGVRFVIYLGDGTAAFAGAGRCVQVSDQGTNVPPNARYETLVDSLELDDRSRPVYDYIVAVRAAAYGQTEGEYAEGQAEEQAEGEYAEAEAHEVSADADVFSEAQAEPEAEAAPLDVDVMSDRPAAQLEPVEEEGFSYEAAPGDVEVSADASEPAPSEYEPAEYGDDASLEEAPIELSAQDAQAVDAYASLRPPEADALEVPSVHPPSARPGSIPAAALDSFRPEAASFIPPPIPTGILQRPARALHWQPAPPRRPTPLPQTGLFRYAGPGLPKPAAPPRPDLDPSFYVERAPRPS